MPLLLVGLLVVVLIAGCASIKTKALTAPLDYWTDDPILYNAMVTAIATWTNIGVANASLMTIELISSDDSDNWKKKDRLPVVRHPRVILYKMCKPSDPAWRGDGCTSITNGEWTGIYIPYDLKDPQRIYQVILHELGHIIGQTKEHTDMSSTAVMHPNSNALQPTEADIVFMKAHTTVLNPEDLIPDLPIDDL